MKIFGFAAALLALVSVEASQVIHEGTIYVYQNSIPRPRTTFLKAGATHGSQVSLVTAGVACKGAQTLPAKGHSGVLAGEFIAVANQWDFNGKHDNEINMGYIRITGTEHCLSLTKGNQLIAAPCPSFSQPIKQGSAFAWFRDKRQGAIWAYGGDKSANESNGLTFDSSALITTGKSLKGRGLYPDSLQNVFIGLGGVALGHTAKSPTGCQ